MMKIYFNRRGFTTTDVQENKRVCTPFENTIEAKLSQGFTLIELLIVIAIIGVLASVIFASLNTARDKGTDATVKADLQGIKGQMAIFYDNNNNGYTGACTTDTNIMNAMTGAKTIVAGTPTVGGFGDGECIDSATQWAAWVNLKMASTSALCIDSTGKSAEISIQDSTAVDLLACP